VKISVIVALKSGREHAASFAACHRRLAETVDLEVLVWDGGPADGAEEALRSGGLVARYRRGPDTGIYDAWNRVLEYASGDYVCFAGIDDRLNDAWLRAVERELRGGDTPQLFYGDLVLKRGEYYRTRSFRDYGRLRPGAIRSMPFAHPGALHHRSLFESRRFDTRFKLAGDLEFLIRAASELEGLTVRKVSGTQVEMGAEGMSHSAKAFGIYRREYQLIEAIHGLRLSHNPARLALLDAIFARWPGLFSLIRDLRWRVLGSRSA
jgi:glycosyltransferase involved in cell wall biosynthesis